jgi:ribose-phosphate pyrophosphokinase
VKYADQGETVMQILSFSSDIDGATRLAVELDIEASQIVRHHFPDGETRITLPPLLSDRVAIFQTLNQPNSKLVELLIAAQTARREGAIHLTLIAPYLCYMRQDTAFRPGEAVSQTIVGSWLADHFDALVTVDPHLHRVKQLREAVPVSTAIALSAASTIGQFLYRQAREMVLIGPDEESAQWVSIAAAAAGCQFGVCQKIRHTDRETTVTLPKIGISGASVVLIDDIASSGGTLMSAATACLAAGASRVDAAVTHALFGGRTAAAMSAAGITNVWSTDSVFHPSNAIALAPLIATAIKDSSPYR